MRICKEIVSIFSLELGLGQATTWLGLSHKIHWIGFGLAWLGFFKQIFSSLASSQAKIKLKNTCITLKYPLRNYSVTEIRMPEKICNKFF